MTRNRCKLLLILSWLVGMAALEPSMGRPVPRPNDFDLEDALVPRERIVSGGPPRDGIPALDAPRFVPARDADWLDSDARVLGLVVDGDSHAYPVAIMNWHEIVNDTLAGRAVVVTYCPLCGSGVAFERRIGGLDRRFGVSGLLYNSDVLLYDRESESLWSQLLGRAIAGPMKGWRLEALPLEHTNWRDWRGRHPRTLVLSRRTGYDRDYDRDPYAGYGLSRRIYFPVPARDRRYHPKEWVVAIEIDGQARAWPFSELARGHTPLRERLAGRELRIEYDDRARTARIYNDRGERLPAVTAYWFAWVAFHPDTQVYQAPGDR